MLIEKQEIRHHNKQIMATNRHFITILFREILEFPFFAPIKNKIGVI